MTTLDVTAKGIEPEEEAVFVPRRYQALRYFMRSRAAMFGGAIVTVLLICAIFAPWLAPHDPTVQNLNMATLPPFWLHGAQPGYWLGTDELGRDILARIIYGARLSSIVAFSVVVIGSLVGVSLGLIAGYVGGFVDDVIMRIADIQLAFPYVLLAIAVIGVIGASLYTIIAVIGITSWVQYVRDRACGSDFAARTRVRASGAGRRRFCYAHHLPAHSAERDVVGNGDRDV